MGTAREGELRAPGAALYYKVRGAGPMLLILQGGDGDAEGADGLADRLVDRFTVVTYDRRGLSRSRIEGEAGIPRGLEAHGDDAHRLLAALTAEPAYVLGFSLGALVGLDLISRHPDRVRVLVAHEPPATRLLPDADRATAVRELEEVEEAYRREGVAAAMRAFLKLAALDFDDREPGVELPRPGPGRAANLEFFLAHDAPAVRLFRPDAAALRASSMRIVVAVGRTSGGTLAHRCALALAGELGTPPVEFPGGHAGFVTHPQAFAARLCEALERQAGA